MGENPNFIKNKIHAELKIDGLPSVYWNSFGWFCTQKHATTGINTSTTILDMIRKEALPAKYHFNTAITTAPALNRTQRKSPHFFFRNSRINKPVSIPILIIKNKMFSAVFPMGYRRNAPAAVNAMDSHNQIFSCFVIRDQQPFISNNYIS